MACLLMAELAQPSIPWMHGPVGLMVVMQEFLRDFKSEQELPYLGLGQGWATLVLPWSKLRVSKMPLASVWIESEPGVRYTTRFVGTRRTRKGAMQPSEIFLSTESNPAAFTFRGDELYVRAKITSDRPPPNPYKAGDKECAWVQPVRGPSGR